MRLRMNKTDNAYKSIGEVAKILNLINKKNGNLNTHTIRFWEKEFKQIKPIILKNRRYYNQKQVELVKLINFLLKDKGLKINGVKKILKKNIKSLDDYNSDSLETSYKKEILKIKSKKILDKINKLKKNG